MGRRGQIHFLQRSAPLEGFLQRNQSGTTAQVYRNQLVTVLKCHSEIRKVCSFFRHRHLHFLQSLEVTEDTIRRQALPTQ